MKHLGDICKINGAEIESVDCITGGSPCQDLSIAGKRAGLAGERSGLFMEQVRIVKEMRERDRKNGRAGDMVRPRFLVWENVPGAFSSNGGGDFQAVLEEIIHIAEPTVSVPRFEGKWTKAGAIDGDGWSVAWRTHDAQYWGVPQRRRRISVVADFGGQSAGEILFERKSVSGHLAESGAVRERLAGNAESGASYAVRIRGGCDGGGKGALVQTEKSGTLGTGNDQTIFCMATQQGGAELRTDDRAPTLTAAAGMSGNNQPIVCLNDQGGNVMGVSHDVSGTLRAQEHGHQPSVLDMSHACDVIRDCGEVSPSLQARMGTGGNKIPLTYQDVTGTLSPGAHAGSYNGQDAYNDMLVCGASPDVAHALWAKAACAYREDAETYPVQNMVVRRLTPLECTRLQGYPDGWVDIGDWTDEKGKKHKDADSPKYKALGNSIALPFWDWMLRRMARYLPEDATLGSLFDGIAGFPLIWERIHGKGTARWASEIEKFPIAVTKLRFPEES
jgi:DNA (cytosine-5)-methyltransferase 1